MNRLLEDGPADYWSTEKLPTPAQNRAIVAAACNVLGIPQPVTRLAATTTLVRLRLAEDDLQEHPIVPTAW